MSNVREILKLGSIYFRDNNVYLTLILKNEKEDFRIASQITWNFNKNIVSISFHGGTAEIQEICFENKIKLEEIFDFSKEMSKILFEIKIPDQFEEEGTWGLSRAVSFPFDVEIVSCDIRKSFLKKECGIDIVGIVTDRVLSELS